MIRRIRPDEFLPLLRDGQPWVAGCVPEEIHLIPCSTLRKAAREHHFDAFKVGTTIFYHVDEVATHLANMDRLTESGANLIMVPNP